MICSDDLINNAILKTEILKEQPTHIHTMNARTGKIARLPRDIRDQLNERLERSEPGPQLLQWLNALPEVKEVLKTDFDGVPISKQNLSEWRQGGFQEWLTRRDLWAEVRDVEDFAGELGEDRENVLADDVATVVAARYASLISKWNGEVDKTFEAKVRVLNGLCRGVVQLQRGMHRAAKNHHDLIQELEAESKRVEEYCKKRLLDQVWAIRREPLVAKLFGGGELGRKLAKYVVALENDMPNAKLEITEEDLAKAKRAREGSKRVKPAQKRRTAKRPRKSKPHNASNPLVENEMKVEPEAESSQAESNPVKPSQTDSPPMSPMSPLSPIPTTDAPESQKFQPLTTPAEDGTNNLL
jgi:hypothetical protein